MTRSSLALALALGTFLATAASAQQYAPYPMPGGAMTGPGMPPHGMYPGMQQPGGYPAMHPGMMPGGMPPGMQQGYPPAGMPPGGAMPGGMPPGMPPSRLPPGMSHDQMMTQGTGSYRGKIADQPRPKLPKGVSDNNGLLFYNGPAHGDLRYAQQPGQFPVQQAAFAQGMEGGVPPEAYNEQDGSVYGNYGECHDPNCQHCRKRHNWLHGITGFAGKLGYNWFASGDVILFTRDSASNATLVQNVNTGQSELNTDGMEFDYQTGGRAMVGFMGPSGIGMQGVFLGVRGYNASATVDGNNDLQIPDPLGAATIDFFGADQMTVSYTSDLDTAEFNILYPWGNFQLIAGYRYLELRENANIRSSDVIDGGTSDFTNRTFNQLHGGQIGILGEWEAFGHVAFDFTAKFGVFNNLASQNQVLRDLDNTDEILNRGGKQNDVAYVSELGAQVVVPLGPIFSVQGGYSVYFINRVALAPNQFDFNFDATSGTDVHQQSNVVFHGANIGLTAIW